ncbi:phage tail protein [Govanella unica]|uniref:Phage tail protein n=1 Tax=Govanella unica TaxID=2975056 RepID=A0A9X3Z8D7_9PROT|nr:phage tail protein [Govania unica]MDA5194958.1 phage tail protein [Govania unica]
MAVLVLAAAGFAAGSGLVGGGLLGIAAGVALGAGGSYLGSQLGGAVDAKVFGVGSRVSEGPRLGDLSVQSSAFGQVIPLLYGTVRVAGNVIWSMGLIETRHEDSEKVKGGKGGGGTRVTTVSYTYASSFAIALSARPIVGIGRIWADGKLLRDAGGRLAVEGLIRIYTGSEQQNPDPLIEAGEGLGQAPAYRGLAYVVFEDLALAEYGNRIPNLTFEVIADKGGAATLAGVIGDLALRAGLARIDVAALDDSVAGYAIARSVTYADAIETLARIYHFDAVEREGVIRFAPLARARVAVIDYENLTRSSGEAAPLTVTRQQELDLPREISVRHADPARDYQVGVQRARRQWTPSLAAYDYDLPLTISADRAKRAAEIELARQWRAREAAAFSLGTAYARLMPGDVITITGTDAPLDLMIAEADFGGGTLACRAVSYASDVYMSGALADGGGVPTQMVEDPAETRLHLLNLPALRAADGTDPVFYAAASSAESRWRGAVLYRSVDSGDSFEAIAALSSPAVAGVAVNALPLGPLDFWDEAARLTVVLDNPAQLLEARPPLAILNGANAALVGEEIIQFREAALDGAGHYVLSGLLRGRRGTDHHMASHVSGERFLLLDAARLVAVTASLSMVGRQDLYKGVSAGALLNAVDATLFQVSAESLRPFAPVHVTGLRNAEGDLAIRWIRRCRGDGGWIDGADVPLDEDSELYEVEILSGAVPLRVLTVATADGLYTAAQQTADFGALQSSISVRIYQMSARVGRGVPAVALL